MMQQQNNLEKAGFINPAKGNVHPVISLQEQLNQLYVEYSFSSHWASIAAKTLRHEGQIRKPYLKKKIDSLKEKIQLPLEFTEVK